MKLKFLYLLLFLLTLSCSSQKVISSRMTYEEKLIYYSLKHIISKQELNALLKMEPSKKDRWLKALWNSKDPTPATEQNEFKDEHQRRVDYVLENFSIRTGDKLWDERGDVYIIYGEPDEKEMRVHKTWQADYKSEVKPPTPLTLSETEDVWDLDSDTQRDRGGKKQDDRSLRSKAPLQREEPTSSTTSYDNFSMTYGEIWHYYAHQLTFQFQDQKTTGSYALVPYTDASGETQSIQEFSAQRVTKVDHQKMIYAHDYQGKPFDYALNILRFRGSGATYNVDINLGFPLRDMGLGGADTSQVDIMRQVSVLDEKLNILFNDSTILRKKVNKEKIGDQLIVDQLICVLNPGEYSLAVEVRDLNTQKVGIYRKKLIIPKYVNPGTQEISPLVMASLIRPAYLGETKFVKHGYVVVPMPSRVYYPNQPIYIYYEIYNLEKDEKGKTGYTIHYSLVDYKKKKQIAFYEPKTFEADRAELFHTAKLDASTIPPGEYALAVRITDINRGKDKVTLAAFKIAEK